MKFKDGDLVEYYFHSLSELESCKLMGPGPYVFRKYVRLDEVLPGKSNINCIIGHKNRERRRRIWYGDSRRMWYAQGRHVLTEEIRRHDN